MAIDVKALLNSGLVGATGATGLTGATGVQGASGSTGLNGATGQTGINGASGFVGSNGATGLTGATGQTGVNGASGFVGSNGATGLTGATGVQGASGSTALAQGLQTMWVPAVSMISRTTNGPGSTTTESATNKVVLRTLDFDTATQEFSQFTIRMPKSWDEGTIRFQPYWTAAAASGGVSWGLQGIALSDGDTIDTAFGVAQVTSDTLVSNTAIQAGPTSIPITVGGTPVANDVCIFQLFRQVANTNDTVPADARLAGISIFYTINSADDV
jgi:hypothetical protein